MCVFVYFRASRFGSASNKRKEEKKKIREFSLYIKKKKEKRVIKKQGKKKVSTFGSVVCLLLLPWLLPFFTLPPTSFLSRRIEQRRFTALHTHSLLFTTEIEGFRRVCGKRGFISRNCEQRLPKASNQRQFFFFAVVSV